MKKSVIALVALAVSLSLPVNAADTVGVQANKSPTAEKKSAQVKKAKKSSKKVAKKQKRPVKKARH